MKVSTELGDDEHGSGVEMEIGGVDGVNEGFDGHPPVGVSLY